MRTTTDLNATGVESPAEWFKGWWHGIAVGSVIGAGLIFILMKARYEPDFKPHL